MRLAIENAGAQTGYLILEKDGRYVFAAKGSEEHVEIPDICRHRRKSGSIAGYRYFVARTSERIVLDDAANEGPFIHDPQISGENTKSLLCAPLLSRGKLIGILYLKNNLQLTR